ncbi:gamma-glutamyltransferase 1 Threonine peptidase. MEROPS family T03 [Marinococcus luteus]|uniref:Gamma-glutamyltransferase 1 Threonine peptidase. MEROPS family T03 n=1 Tax=Marinococcus luteus TaxID=1122204 RepID=A0A1H2QHC4_9BACI|nr:gamma-glutamyltransferase [Marinococcus luteus]SDW06495.1 gamma-glutamyltransferase 1 Threonine peptidase. MEROPS family T03 [Marinococcus luteus]
MVHKKEISEWKTAPLPYFAYIRRFTPAAALLSALVISGCSSDEESENESAPPEEETDTNENEEAAEEESEPSSEPTTDYGVSAGHPEAVEAGMEVLDNGGNAADAAVAAAYAVSVVEPFASGIGGGGSVLIQEQGEAPQAYDYREVVPEGGIPSSDIGVPGFTAGMNEFHADYGTAEWEELLDPAVTLADSSEVSGLLADQLESGEDRLPVRKLSHFYPDGEPLEAGTTVEQDELADTLRDIRDNGSSTLYEGEAGESLASQIKGINAASLEAFEISQNDPSIGSYAGYDIIGAAPPLPGISVIQMLQMLEERGSMEAGRDSTDFIHDTAMSWRLASQFIETDYGDPNFVDVPVDELTDPEQNAELAAEISGDSLISEEEASSYTGDPNTTHITVVDEDGTFVSMTNTLTNFWGSGKYADGYFLNNQMNRFDIGEGSVNEPEPGRRSVTWSSPMLVANDDGPVLGIGSPGGERIPIMLTQIIADWAENDAGLAEAVEAPRFHLDGDELVMEEQPETEQREELLAIGYEDIRDQPTPLYFGSIQALALDQETGELSGARDPRREADWQSSASE